MQNTQQQLQRRLSKLPQRQMPKRRHLLRRRSVTRS
jgi:hypothetical protein